MNKRRAEGDEENPRGILIQHSGIQHEENPESIHPNSSYLLFKSPQSISYYGKQDGSATSIASGEHLE